MPGKREHAAGAGRLRARPAGVDEDAAPGTYELRTGAGRSAFLYVPATYRPEAPAPLAVMLHGAGGDAARGLAQLRAEADEAGLLLMAPASADVTWDVLRGGFGPDVAVLDALLAFVFTRCRVDPGRLALGGFSDGASYALSLGITNGDLFTHLLAFSPGFASPASQAGRPRLFVSHGTGDTVLPIGPCSRRVVPVLEGAGYDVCYREFAGGHLVPPTIAHEAVEWFVHGRRCTA